MVKTQRNLTLGEALQQALQHQQAGRLDEAEELYRQVLKVAPNQPDALHLLGLVYSDKKNFSTAEELIRQAITSNPVVAEFHNNLGSVCQEQGKLEESAGCFRKAIALKPDYAEAYNNLGNVVFSLGQLLEATAYYRQAVALRPTYVKAWNNLGAVLGKQNELEEAEKCYRLALELAPDNPSVLKNLAENLVSQGRLVEGETFHQKAVQLSPGDQNVPLEWVEILRRYGKSGEAETYLDKLTNDEGVNTEFLLALGDVFRDMKKLEKAIVCYTKATELSPDSYEAYKGLGITLHDQGAMFAKAREKQRPLAVRALQSFQVARKLRDSAEAINNVGTAHLMLDEFEEAKICFRKAIELEPGRIEHYLNFGVLFERTNNIEETFKYYQYAMQLQPGYANTFHYMIGVLENAPDVSLAIESLRCAIEAIPDASELQRVLAYATDLDPSADPEMQQMERRRWHDKYVKAKHPGTLTLLNSADTQRKIRIGYLPGRFYRNASVYAFAPMLLYYDKSRFEVYCYSNFEFEDDLTLRIKQNVDGWRSIEKLSDEEAAILIRDDEIDILVDLFGHAGANRLPIYAYKPAPIQVTAWGHANGTGMPEMDYLFSDPVSIPADERHLYAEEVVDLPCQLAYWCPGEAPSVVQLPALKTDHITFGCFNRAVKVSNQSLELWAKLLAGVQNSRLILKDDGWQDEAKRELAFKLFRAEGVSTERITFLERTNWHDHLRAYDEVDIALDPFPMGGGVTTLDTLWMGVPVVCIKGNTLGKRITSAIVSAVGLQDWIAESFDEYIEIARTKAANIQELASLRKNLRSRVFASPLGNPDIYVRWVEHRFREMWERWCDASVDVRHFENLAALVDSCAGSPEEGMLVASLQGKGISPSFLEAVDIWKTFKRMPDDASENFMLARLVVKFGKFSLALEMASNVQGAVSLDKTSIEFCRKAELALERGDFNESVEMLLHVLAVYPRDTTVLMMLDTVSMFVSTPIISPTIAARKPRAKALENPLVSVTICSYNHEKYIRECVESVLAQSYSPLEIIIADDGSADRTAELIESCIAEYAGPHEVIFVRNKKNLGVGGRANFVDAYRKSSGRFVAQFCGDDVMYPQMIERMVDVWLTKRVSVVAVNAERIDAESRFLGTYYHDPRKTPDNSLENLLRNGVNDSVFGAGMGYDREVYELFAYCHNNPPCHLGTTDIALAFYGGLLDGCETIYEPLMKYRMHGVQGSLSIALAGAKEGLEKLIVEERMWHGHLAHAIYMREVLGRLEILAPVRYLAMKERFKPLLDYQLLIMASRQVDARKKLYYQFGIMGLSRPGQRSTGVM